MSSEIIALIPAYEPDGKLIALLENIKQNTAFRVVVVDDGSAPDKEPIFKKAEEYGTVLHHDKNYGKGRALRTGLTYIVGQFAPDDVVVTMDADGQHTVPDAIRVSEVVSDKERELAVGGRKFTGKVPFRSRWGNGITRFVYRASTGVRVHDTQSGLRAFGVGMIPFLLTLGGDRYEYEMNMLMACAKNKIPINEIEIETIYLDDNESSHFNAVKDSFRIYKNILKFSASSFISFIVDYLLYALLSLFAPIPLAACNIMARVVSSSVNFYINKRFVFNNKDNIFKKAVEYFLLAAVVLALNTLLLTLLVENTPLGELVGKLIVEVVLFVFSFIVQKLFVFKKKKKD